MKKKQGDINFLLKKIIRSGIGKWRLWVSAIAMFAALFIVLLSLQFFINFQQLLYAPANANETDDFLVLSKTVTADNQSKKEASYFSKDEINDLLQQEFTVEIGEISSSNFMVSISSFSDALPFYTDAYFESVPDDFIDLKNADWKWEEGQMNIPVIIPSFFLELYNTGMAMSQQNLPRLSLDALQAIPLKVLIKHSGGEAQFVAHVVGTTDRLNSVLVPNSFMEFANRQFGYQDAKPPSRLVLKTKDASAPELKTYLDERNISTNAEKTRFNKVRQIVNWIVAVIGGIGLLMLFFGILLFTMFIQLTIASARAEIVLLQTLGTSPKQLIGFLGRQMLPLFSAIVFAVLVILSFLQYRLHLFLGEKQLTISPWLSIFTIAAASFWIVVCLAANRLTIKRFLA